MERDLCSSLSLSKMTKSGLLKNIRILKFGGSSLASKSEFFRVAEIIRKDRLSHSDSEHVIVVSARMGRTNELIKLAAEYTNVPFENSQEILRGRELDMLLTVGERESMSLLAMILCQQGVDAVSLTGSQSGIVTDASHGNAKIQSIKATRVEALLKEGKVVVMAGFQGVSNEKEITTLGRGGSDLTAIALASHFSNSTAVLFSDVRGVHLGDPKIWPTAPLIREISWADSLKLAQFGMKAIYAEAAELAKKYSQPFEMKSTFESEESGTFVGDYSATSAPYLGVFVEYLQGDYFRIHFLAKEKINSDENPLHTLLQEQEIEGSLSDEKDCYTTQKYKLDQFAFLQAKIANHFKEISQ